MHGFVTASGDWDRARGRARADRDRGRDGGPGSVGLVPGAAISKNKSAHWYRQVIADNGARALSGPPA